MGGDDSLAAAKQRQAAAEQRRQQFRQQKANEKQVVQDARELMLQKRYEEYRAKENQRIAELKALWETAPKDQVMRPRPKFDEATATWSRPPR
eukprot:gnl/TRDRNA2_/TRDRNA2_143084_c2_seq1.p2 gnl/TRDRNA2_/TRDRNA2_143084_c2~~gnl/TRDRNA2_/TRDRNA2_143084_c2_seq1.p2  ORF type:complete len:108 (+),score=31.33 gnl/TRDRNA2_/TRDRNA2_143084_c2_seq1:46-324(+)